MNGNPLVDGLLQAALEDLDAAHRLLVPPPNRLASYHLQQAAEKLAKAVLVARGVHTTKEHRLEILLDALLPEDPWRERLRELVHLDRFATAFRYPGTTGRLPAGEATEKAHQDEATLRGLLEGFRKERAEAQDPSSLAPPHPSRGGMG
jgi:HEPN domain-containing protein